MVDDFNYINARIRGMRAGLLSGAEFRSLVEAPDLEKVFAQLRGTVYGLPLQSALARKGGIDGAEEGLRSGLLVSFSRIVCISSGNSGGIVRAAMGRWERQCLKTILRGKKARASPEEILAAALPAGIFDETALRRLVALENVEEVLDTLRLWGYPLARRLRRLLREEGRERPRDLEHLLDQEGVSIVMEFLEGAGDEGEALRQMTHLEIDSTNVSTALRFVRSGGHDPVAAGAYFLEGGKSVSRAVFRSLLSSTDAEGALRKIGENPVSKPFREGLPAYRRTGKLSAFEKSVHSFLKGQARKWSARDALGIGVALGFLWDKSQEVADLRMICRAKHADMPPGRLGEELFGAFG